MCMFKHEYVCMHENFVQVHMYTCVCVCARARTRVSISPVGFFIFFNIFS